MKTQPNRNRATEELVTALKFLEAQNTPARHRRMLMQAEADRDERLRQLRIEFNVETRRAQHDYTLEVREIHRETKQDATEIKRIKAELIRRAG